MYDGHSLMVTCFIATSQQRLALLSVIEQSARRSTAVVFHCGVGQHPFIAKPEILLLNSTPVHNGQRHYLCALNQVRHRDGFVVLMGADGISRAVVYNRDSHLFLPAHIGVEIVSLSNGGQPLFYLVFEEQLHNFVIHRRFTAIAVDGPCYLRRMLLEPGIRLCDGVDEILKFLHDQAAAADRIPLIGQILYIKGHVRLVGKSGVPFASVNLPDDNLIRNCLLYTSDAADD